jgi:putative ABC transport system permease protein
MLPTLIALALICALVAGSFPALVLSAFQPVQVLKGKLRVGRGIGFSKSLVVFQFAVSVLLIAATLVIYKQIDFVKQYNLGFADEEIVIISLNGSQAENETRLERFRARLATAPDIVEVTGTSNAFGESWSSKAIVYTTRVEPNYLVTLDIPLLEGRNFDPNLTTDTEDSIIINEAFAREMGWTDPIGQELPGYEGVRVIGKVADYHFRSLHNTIEPALLHMSPQIGSFNFIMVRLRSRQIQETLRLMQDTWQEIALNEPFTYEFMDQRLDRQYQAEEQWSRIVTYASFFALLIACLGLFGLTTLTVTRRTKEIGIRKVLGASVTGIVLLLSRNFLVLVCIALLPAVPITYYVMNTWLGTFAYHIEISWAIFLVTGLTALGIAFLTVSYQAVRAALSDPVDTLRYE